MYMAANSWGDRYEKLEGKKDALVHSKWRRLIKGTDAGTDDSLSNHFLYQLTQVVLENGCKMFVVVSQYTGIAGDMSSVLKKPLDINEAVFTPVLSQAGQTTACK